MRNSNKSQLICRIDMEFAFSMRQLFVVSLNKDNYDFPPLLLFNLNKDKLHFYFGQIQFAFYANTFQFNPEMELVSLNATTGIHIENSIQF